MVTNGNLVYLNGLLVPPTDHSISVEIHAFDGYAKVDIPVDDFGTTRNVESLEVLHYQDGLFQARYYYDPTKADYTQRQEGRYRSIRYILRPA